MQVLDIIRCPKCKKEDLLPLDFEIPVLCRKAFADDLYINGIPKDIDKGIGTFTCKCSHQWKVNVEVDSNGELVVNN